MVWLLGLHCVGSVQVMSITLGNIYGLNLNPTWKLNV